MRFLLDTHVLLWWRDASPRLSRRARGEIAAADNQIFVSVATLWEIVVKRGLGNLRFPDDLETVLREEDFGLLAISFRHLQSLEALPRLHGDPFDRMLLAQAIAEGMPLVSDDRALQPYQVPLFW